MKRLLHLILLLPLATFLRTERPKVILKMTDDQAIGDFGVWTTTSPKPQRRAYGFRNFNNYRLRVITRCG